LTYRRQFVYSRECITSARLPPGQQPRPDRRGNGAAQLARREDAGHTAKENAMNEFDPSSTNGSSPSDACERRVYIKITRENDDAYAGLEASEPAVSEAREEDEGKQPEERRESAAASGETSATSIPSRERTPEEQAILDLQIRLGDHPAWVERHAELILDQARFIGNL
jgi:hypothetical protein